MPDFEQFSAILKIPGVDQYILVDRDAKILSRKIAEPEKMAKIVAFCGLKSSAVGKANFRYLAVSRETRDHFFIFPVGKYYLGVIKEKNTGNAFPAENIIRFIKDFWNRNQDFNP